MTGETWQILRQEAASYPLLFGTPVDEGLIESAEMALGVTFDSVYRRFLKDFGGAMLGSSELFGLSRVEVMDDELWSVVTVTEHFRRNRWPDIGGWYIISISAFGDPVGVAPDGTVRVSGHHGEGVLKLASTFEGYLRSRL